MNGTSTVRGLEVEVDVSPSDIFENLQFGAMGYFGARKGNWGFGVDALYMALGTTIDTPPANVDPGQGAFTFVGTRRLNDKVEAVFGARWNFIQGKIEFTGPQNLTENFPRRSRHLKLTREVSNGKKPRAKKDRQVPD
jgi:hypothetical protein